MVFNSMSSLGLSEMLWLGAAISVSLTVLVQELIGAVHPPGGATALIYIITPSIQDMGYWFVLCPSFLGAVIMVAVACVTNNLAAERIYPQYWWPWWPWRLKELEIEDGNSLEEGSSAETRADVKCWKKFLGAGGVLPGPPLAQTWCSVLGAFVGIATLGVLALSKGFGNFFSQLEIFHVFSVQRTLKTFSAVDSHSHVYHAQLDGAWFIEVHVVLLTFSRSWLP